MKLGLIVTSAIYFVKVVAVQLKPIVFTVIEMQQTQKYYTVRYMVIVHVQMAIIMILQTRNVRNVIQIVPLALDQIFLNVWLVKQQQYSCQIQLVLLIAKIHLFLLI